MCSPCCRPAPPCLSAPRLGDLERSRPCLPAAPPFFLRPVPGFSRGKASGSSSSYHVAVVPGMGRLFSRPGLLSAASSSRICTGQRGEHTQGQLALTERCSQGQSCGFSTPKMGPSLQGWTGWSLWGPSNSQYPMVCGLEGFRHGLSS